MVMPYPKFEEELLAKYDEAAKRAEQELNQPDSVDAGKRSAEPYVDIKVAVGIALKWYVDENRGNDDEGPFLKGVFETKILPLTGQRKKASTSAESYLEMVIKSWRKGTGDTPLALSAYYWLHRAVDIKKYARRIDEKLRLDFSTDFPEFTAHGAKVASPRFPKADELVASRRTKDIDKNGAAKTNDKIATFLNWSPTPFFLNMPGSGYEFKDLLGIAQEELFVCGQNLFGLTKERVGERFITLEYIQRAIDRGVTVKLLICNPDETDHIRPWSFAVGADEYGDHLLRAAKIFRDWAKNYPNGELSVRFARFIPTSVNFVDPRRPGSRLATLTAHCFEPVRTARPFMLLTPQSDPEIFDFYFKNFDFVWDHAKDPSEVNAINPT